MRHLRALALAAVAALALGTAACSDESTPDPGTTGAPDEIRSGLKIAFLPKQVNNAYFDTSDNQGGNLRWGRITFDHLAHRVLCFLVA